MDLCETCAQKQKDDEIFKALNAMETEFVAADGLCQIMRDLDNPPRYLYERVAEHLQAMEQRFYHLWHVLRGERQAE